MEYLEAKLATREVDGIWILDTLTICHRLFVDDVGVFIPTMEESFGKLQSILKLYELASSAKLTLSKSIIVPLALPTILQWLANTGCTINTLGEVHKYLGAPFGLNLKSLQLHDFCLDWISKRIKGWENKLLSFIEQVLLIQHILQSISIYHIMYIETPTRTTKHINRMFKNFLWGLFLEGQNN